MTIAVMESPGMPKTSAGIQAPLTAPLLEAPASTRPSTWPVPNFSGSLEKRLLTRVGDPGGDVGAGAGKGADGGADDAAAQRPGPDSAEVLHLASEDPFAADLATSGRASRSTTDLRTSDTAKRPIIAGDELDAAEQVDIAEGVARLAGGIVDADCRGEEADHERDEPRGTEPGETKTAQDRPSTTSQKYSKDENFSATSARDGRRDDQDDGAEQSADDGENERGAKSLFGAAAPGHAVGVLDIGRAGRRAGMRSSAPGMSPAKIAIAVAVTMAAMAGTGSMKKVIGTSSAVAMVAVRPGIAPTNMPKQADPRMTSRT